MPGGKLSDKVKKSKPGNALFYPLLLFKFGVVVCLNFYNINIALFPESVNSFLEKSKGSAKNVKMLYDQNEEFEEVEEWEPFLGYDHNLFSPQTIKEGEYKY